MFFTIPLNGGNGIYLLNFSNRDNVTLRDYMFSNMSKLSTGYMYHWDNLLGSMPKHCKWRIEYPSQAFCLYSVTVMCTKQITAVAVRTGYSSKGHTTSHVVGLRWVVVTGYRCEMLMMLVCGMSPLSTNVSLWCKLVCYLRAYEEV
jgi:hypothetical protein